MSITKVCKHCKKKYKVKLCRVSSKYCSKPCFFSDYKKPYLSITVRRERAVKRVIAKLIRDGIVN